jgi:hypothetical protein
MRESEKYNQYVQKKKPTKPKNLQSTLSTEGKEMAQILELSEEDLKQL